MTIAAANAEKMYGDADPAFANATLTLTEGGVASELSGIDLSVSRTNTAEDVDVYEDVLTISSTKAELEAEYTNYEFTITPADFEIKAKTSGLSVEGKTKSQVYNGQALVGEGSGEADDGSEVTIKYSVKTVGEDGTESWSEWSETAPSITNVGVVTYKVQGSNPNYATVESDEYTLTVTKAKITVNATDSREYNGSDQTLTLTADDADGVVSGETLTLSGATITGKAAGDYTTVAADYTWSVAKADGSNSTGNYTIEVTGKLTITANDDGLSVKSGSYTWTYDGQSHTYQYYTVIYGETSITGTEGQNRFTLSTGDTVSITPKDSAKITHVSDGQITNAFDYTVTNSTSYSNQSKSEGTLKVTPAAVTLKSESGSKPYDGSPLTKPEVTVGGDGATIFQAEVRDIQATGSVTTVAQGEVTNTITYTAGTNFKADNYTITKDEGTLKIEASTKALVIGSSTKSWTYDGETHKDEVYTVTYDGEAATADSTGKVFTLSTGDTVTITATAAGVKDYSASYSENNTYTYEISNAGSYSDVTANVGTLSIDKAAVTLTSESGEKPYDGQPLTKPEVTVGGAGAEIFQTEVSEIKATGSVTTVAEGEVTNTITYTEGEAFKADNYTITKSEGTLKIAPAALTVTITGNTATETYNGIEQSVTGYTISIPEGAMLTADEISGPAQIAAIAKGTDANTDPGYTMGLSAGDFSTTNTNYAVTFNVTDGWLKINPKVITIGDDSDFEVSGADDVTYNGEEQKQPITVTDGDTELNEGTDFELAYSKDGDDPDDLTNAGTVTVTIAGQGNYTGVVIVSYQITPRKVVLTSESARKKYDGKALERPDVTGWEQDDEAGTGFVEGEVSDVKAIGSITKPGSVTNTIEYTPTEGKFDENNYNITLVEGKLSVYKPSSGGGDKTPALNTEDHIAYVIGYEDETVRPENNITRAEVAMIFFRLLTDETRDAALTDVNSYSDVEVGDWYNTAVSTMSALGIIKGYPDGTFKPNNFITRAEFAAIAARFDDHVSTGAVTFNDIKGHWAEEEVCRAAELGWVTGYPDGSFRPDQFITRAEAMTLINRVLVRNPETVDDLLDNMPIWKDNADPNRWYFIAVQEASISHDYARKTNNTEYWTGLRTDTWRY